MKYINAILAIAAVWCFMCHAEISTSEELIARTSLACRNTIQFDTSFKVDVMQFKESNASVCAKATADLSLALYYMNQYDRFLDINALNLHNEIASNILNNASIPNDSWLKYAAGYEYINGLNADGLKDRGFVVTTNLIEFLQANQPLAAGPNYWEAMIEMAGCPEATILDALRVNAAIELYDRGEHERLGVYTNTLPVAVYNFFLNEIRE